MTKNIKYIVYRDGDYFVSQCLNVDVSSFGNTVEEAIQNIHEALELYFEDNNGKLKYIPVEEALIDTLRFVLFA